MPACSRQQVLLWILSAPVLVSWGLGTVHPALDLLAVPGSILLAGPALLGWAGVIAVAVVVALGARSRGLDRLLGDLGALSLLASALAATRPLPWVVIACALLARPGSREVWSPPRRSLPWLGLAAWILASRSLPWGPGLLPEPLAVVLGRIVELLPARFPDLGPLLIAVAVAVVLSRRAAPDRRGALVGALLALLAVATFGSRQAWLSAAVIGAVAGGWPVPLERSPLRTAAPLLALCLLCTLRPGATERWNCEAAGLDPIPVWWATEPDLDSLAVIPGNVPWLVVIAGGDELVRYGSNGLVSEAIPLDPPGGRLLSTGLPGPFARVVPLDGQTRVQWWDPARLEPVASVDLSDCRLTQARLTVTDDAVLLACRGQGLRRLLPDGRLTVWSGAAIDGVPQGAQVALRGGPISRVHTVTGDSAGVGPWTVGLEQGPNHLFVARGPAGQVEVRGAGPTIPGRQETPSVRDRALIRRTLDRVRVGAWPGAVHYSAWQSSIYVTSPLDGRVWLVDPEVTWHSESARVGAPPRQVVVDATSGTLYGVNRCGLFEVRIKSTFPWRSTGDEESASTPKQEQPK